MGASGGGRRRQGLRTPPAAGAGRASVTPATAGAKLVQSPRVAAAWPARPPRPVVALGSAPTEVPRGEWQKGAPCVNAGARRRQRVGRRGPFAAGACPAGSCRRPPLTARGHVGRRGGERLCSARSNKGTRGRRREHGAALLTHRRASGTPPTHKLHGGRQWPPASVGEPRAAGLTDTCAASPVVAAARRGMLRQAGQGECAATPRRREWQTQRVCHRPTGEPDRGGAGHTDGYSLAGHKALCCCKDGRGGGGWGRVRTSRGGRPRKRGRPPAEYHSHATVS